MARAAFDPSLGCYLRDIQKYPLLTQDEEVALAERWRNYGDREAADRLVTSHLRLVANIARRYRGYGLPLSELVSEGNLGMVQAVKRFDPDRGFRLTTYAVWWVRAAIQSYVLRSWSLVKVGTTTAQRKLFFNLRGLKSQLQAIDAGDLSPEVVKKIATELAVSEAEVVGMNRRLAAPDSSLNAPISSDGDVEWLALLPDETPDQEAAAGERGELAYRRRLVQAALSRLSSRERDILFARRLKDEPSTLDELSQRHAVSRERIRQIEGGAIDKLQRAVRWGDGDRGALAGASRALPVIPSAVFSKNRTSPPIAIEHAPSR
jgi:RNA polymerase sigma-32 factor